MFLRVLCVLALTLSLAGPAAAIPPFIDGNINDLIAYVQGEVQDAGGCGVHALDLEGDVKVFDPQYIPCPPIVANYYLNGFDLTHGVVAYDPTNQLLYLGLRVAGVLGDTDGNGNNSTTGGGGCNPADNVVDQAAIGNNEEYRFLLDLDGDLVGDGFIELRNNAVSHGGLGAINPVVAYANSDIEIRVPIALPNSFGTQWFAGADFDGLNEDIVEAPARFLPCVSSPTPTQTGTWGSVKATYR